MSKAEAGFHILMLLSFADGKLNKAESAVIIDFLNDHFTGDLDIIKEQAFIYALPSEAHEQHFEEVAQHFFTITTEDERHTLTRFAMDVVMADEDLKQGENRFITKLYDLWAIE
ncbi:MAG: TerB family tellurite resistance protein [Bacteroidia bacterium]|nr:TerB family tellurite resistance protein [Bacteroidia bacterium]MCC7533816.1 TerB family tellurite resistance protein [Bacteroidia bacterium]